MDRKKRKLVIEAIVTTSAMLTMFGLLYGAMMIMLEVHG